MVIYSKLCNHAHHQKQNLHYHLNTVCWPQLEYKEAFLWVNSSVSLKLTFWKFLAIQTSLGVAFTSLCIPLLHLCSPLMFSAVSHLAWSLFSYPAVLSVPHFTSLHSLGTSLTQLFIYCPSLTQQTQGSCFLSDPRYPPLSALSPTFSAACQNFDIFQYLLKASLLSLPLSQLEMMWFSVLFSFVVSGLFLMSDTVLPLLSCGSPLHPNKGEKDSGVFTQSPGTQQGEEMGVIGGPSTSWKLCSYFQPFTPCRTIRIISSPLPESSVGAPHVIPPLHPKALPSEKALKISRLL